MALPIQFNTLKSGTKLLFLAMISFNVLAEDRLFIMTEFGEAPPHYAAQGLTHQGIDIRVNIGTPVIAANDGEVVWVEKRFDGQWLHPAIRIKHQGDIQTFYYHIDNILVEHQQMVKQGQVIAYTAKTGKRVPNQPGIFPGAPHLHFETRGRTQEFDPKTLGFTCPKPESKWWWPVGCDSYKGFIVPIPPKLDKPKQQSEPEEPLVEIPTPK
jgi:murein DD-endopeptidase MepM/ murein hydrolase activator NlpD